MHELQPPSFLKNKTIVWFSSKPTDAKFLFSSGINLSIIGLIGSLEDVDDQARGFTLEALESHRYDYDTFGWDSLTTQQADSVVDVIEKLDDVVVLPFSSSEFVSNLELEYDHVKVAGNPHLLEQVFNNKPWVETQLKNLGIKTPDWQYVMSTRQHNLPDDDSLWVTRLSDTSGGLGMQQTNRPSEARRTLSVQSPLGKDILSFAPFIEDALSLNISACVFPSGEVTLHPLSLQIIGSSACTDRRFGYCGNDFGAAEHLSDSDIQRISDYTKQVGEWLLSYGYIGAFGIDYMIADGSVYFSELNPRFQASSHIGAELMDKLGYQNIYFDHLAAFAGIAPERAVDNLVDLTRRQAPKSQIFAYNTPLVDEELTTEPESSTYNVDLEWKSNSIDPHGLLFRLYKDRSVMSDGKSLDQDVVAEVVWHKMRIASRINNHEA